MAIVYSRRYGLHPNESEYEKIQIIGINKIIERLRKMPHDKNNNVVMIDDIVSIDFKVKRVYATDNNEYCNCELESIELMPGNNLPINLSAVNTRQTYKK